MFRKRRRPTPQFKIPSPYNPIAGQHANLRQDGTAPFCAMFQVAKQDVHEDYVICRGFDPRILRFVDYADGDENKRGISIAKPYGKRIVGAYEIGEIYPALLPTQGNANFTDFGQVTNVPPSPEDVHWRVGQNPGVVSGGGLEGGHPNDLTDTIEVLYDHHGKVVNWLLLDASPVGARIFVLTANFVGNGPCAAKWTTRLGTDSRGAMDVVCYENLLDGALIGYRGTAILIDGEWVAPGLGCP